MSSIIGRTAFRAAPRLRATAVPRQWTRSQSQAGTATTNTADTASGEREASKNAVKAGAKRDPELIVLFVIMSGIFGVAGWHFSRSPTSGSSERAVSKIPDSEPWKEGGGSGKYQYSPGGDTNAPKKDAPSALNVVIVPNVTLPKELHDQYNKWGKDGYP